MLGLTDPYANVFAPRRCALSAAVFGLLASFPAAAQVHYNATNDHYYERVSAPSSTWQQANSAALARTHSGRYGHLVTITSVQERDFVASKFGSTPLPLWLGGYRSTASPNPALGWYWVTGEAWSFTSWFSGEPNNTGGQENYLMLAHSPTTWNDCGASCGASGYIVEYPPAPANGFGDPGFSANSLQGSTTLISPTLGTITLGSTGYMFKKSAGGSTGGGFASATAAAASFTGSINTSWEGTSFVAQGAAEVQYVAPGESVSAELLGGLSWNLERDYETDYFINGNNVQFQPSGDPETGRGMLLRHYRNGYYKTYFSSGPYSVDVSLNASNFNGYENAELRFPLQPLGYKCGLTGWTSRGIQSPGRIGSTPLIYDSARAQLLTVTDDNPVRTLAWNGSSWTTIFSGGVTPRTAAALAYDSVRSRVVLFGGDAGRIDTWEWDGATWSEKQPTGTRPLMASASSMVFHAALGEMVVVGVETESGEYAAFRYNGSRWQPSHWFPAYFSLRIVSSCYDPAQQAAVYLIAGEGDRFQVWNYTAAGWSYKGDLKSNSNATIYFDPRSARLTAFDPSVFRDQGPGTFGATLEWVSGQWQLMSVRSPSLMNFTRVLAGYDTSRAQLVAVAPQTNGTSLVLEHVRAENPFVTLQSNLTRKYGVPALITPVVQVAGDRTFEWRRNGVALAANPRYHVSSSGVLTIDSFRHSDAGNFSVAVTNECGTTTSGASAVSGYFACPGDINFDGFVDDADFVTFVAAYDTLFAPPANEFADLNSDWLVDDADFQAFALRYNDLLCP